MVDPRNVIFINEYTLLASEKNETLNDISTDQLRKAIKNFLSGVTENDDYSIYDCAVYICEVVSNNCFGKPEKHEDDDNY